MSEQSDRMNAIIRGTSRPAADAADVEVTEAGEPSVGFDGGARKTAPQQRTPAQWFNDLVDQELHGGSVARGRR